MDDDLNEEALELGVDITQPGWRDELSGRVDPGSED